CTTAWDTAHSVISLMGDRFVILRIDSTKHRHDFGRRAIRNTGDEVKMRRELADAVGGLIAHASLTETTLTDAENDQLIAAADIATFAPPAVEYDYKGDVSRAHAPKMPPRFAKQLAQIIRGGVAIGLPRQAGMRLAIRCARDSIPPLRLEIILDVAAHPGASLVEIRKRIRKPYRTVKRQVDALEALAVLTVDQTSDTSTGGAKKTDVYDLNPEFDRAALTAMAAI